MIVDSHAHAFPPMGGPSGFVSSERHAMYTQHGLAHHHQPVRRFSDHMQVREQTLCDGEDVTLDGLTEVGFRGGGFGRLAWTAGGEECYLQYLPPTLTNLSAPPELMVAQMDYVGVDKAVLQTGHLYGRLNGYLAEAVKRFPERFWALAMIDEWKTDSPSQLRALERAIDGLGLHGLWFQTSALEQHGRDETVDDKAFRPFWDSVRDMRIPVYLNATAAGPGLEPYLAQLAAFERWLERYPGYPRHIPARAFTVQVHARRGGLDTRGGVAGLVGAQPRGRDTDPDIPGRDMGVPIRGSAAYHTRVLRATGS